MEISNKLQESITQIALIIFAILLALIIYVFFSSNTKTITMSQAKNINATKQNNATSAQATLTPKHLAAKTKLTTTNVQSSKPEQVEKTRQDKVKTVKLDDYKVPNNNPKLSELIPEELRNNIKKSLLTPEQIQALSPAERLKYQETRRKLATVLRSLSQTEAENQRLQHSLTQAEQQKQQLDQKVRQLQVKE